MKEETRLTRFIYKTQALGLWILGKFFLSIGIRTSSFIGGTLFTIFGPFTPPTWTAMKNIGLAMPNLTFFQRFKIMLAMWNNLGRDLAEFVGFHSNDFHELLKYVNIDSSSVDVLKKIKANENGGMIFTAHFGNWELFSQVFMKYNIPLSAIYREMNNKYADDIVLKYREKSKIELIPKGQKGVIKLARSLKQGRKLLMLVDQRLSNGITVPFFGMPTKTSDSVATFALKYGYKVYCAVVFRRSFSCYFDVKVEEFDVVNTGNLEEDIRQTTIKINEKIEEWIRTKPEQWFWVHRRWKE